MLDAQCGSSYESIAPTHLLRVPCCAVRLETSAWFFRVRGNRIAHEIVPGGQPAAASFARCSPYKRAATTTTKRSLVLLGIRSCATRIANCSAQRYGLGVGREKGAQGCADRNPTPPSVFGTCVSGLLDSSLKQTGYQP